MPGWSDLGTAFSTLRELDVNAIREEAERPLTVGLLGPAHLADAALHMLTNTGSRRYPPAGLSPLQVRELAPIAPTDALARADMLLILLDGRGPVSRAQRAVLEGLAQLGLPTVIALWGVALPPGAASEVRPLFSHAHIAGIADPEAPAAPGALADAILERLPGDLHLSAARRLPGLRPSVARQLIGATAFANASYALASALPEQIPLLSLPFAAADTIVLTKNQALLVYRLGLAHGAPPEFTARLLEVLPVIGGGYIWRQAARTVVSLIPIWGIVPKVAIAYAGTYTTGVAAWRWFADGELVSQAALKQISEEATRVGRERATALVAAAKESGEQSGGAIRRFGDELRRRLPGLPGRRPPTSTPGE